MLVFSYMYTSTFCIITHVGGSILKRNLNFHKVATQKICEQYDNMASFPVWLQIQYGGMLMFLCRLQIFCKQLYVRLFK